MSAVIEIGYSKDEAGEVSVLAFMRADEANPTELAYAKQAMVYVHKMLETNLDHLNLPRSLEAKSLVLIGSSVDDDDDDSYGGSSFKHGEPGNEPIGVKFQCSSNYSEIGCMNQVHNVVGKAVFDMLSEAINSVAV